MARPQKSGADYFPFDVGFFSDIKIRIVMTTYGADGALLYIYLLTKIYEQGYFTVCDSDLIYIISADLRIDAEKIKSIISFCCGRSLFDSTLFKERNILTSVAIQRRYQEIVKCRALKNPVSVDESLWLLDETETKGFILVRPHESFSKKNRSYSKKNSNYSKKNPTKKSKVKENKENENKVKEDNSSTLAVPLSSGKSYIITSDALNNLINAYSNIDVKLSIRKMIDYLSNNPEKRRNELSIENYIRMWLDQDSSKATAEYHANSGSYSSSNTPKSSDPNTSYDISVFEKYDLLDF